MLTWLSPTKRKTIHSIFTAVAAITVILNVSTDAVVAPWLDVLSALLAVVSMILGAIAARKADWKAIYAGAAVLIGAIAATGVISEDRASQAVRVVEQLIVLIPLVAITVRTDTNTVTGEPVAELVARDVVHDGVIDGGGGVDPSVH